MIDDTTDIGIIGLIIAAIVFMIMAFIMMLIIVLNKIGIL